MTSDTMILSWHSYNWVDWVIVLILLVSIGFSMARGFIRETLSLAVWVLAVFNAYLLGDKMATLLAHWISRPSLSITMGMLTLFVMTLLVGALLNHVLAEMVKKSGLTAADRILGIFFGLARGVIIAMVLTLFVPGSVSQTQGWQHSILVPSFHAWEMDSRETVQHVGDFFHHALPHKE